jgi:hypothetical protein
VQRHVTGARGSALGWRTEHPAHKLRDREVQSVVAHIGKRAVDGSDERERSRGGSQDTDRDLCCAVTTQCAEESGQCQCGEMVRVRRDAERAGGDGPHRVLIGQVDRDVVVDDQLPDRGSVEFVTSMRGDVGCPHSSSTASRRGIRSAPITASLPCRGGILLARSAVIAAAATVAVSASVSEITNRPREPAVIDCTAADSAAFSPIRKTAVMCRGSFAIRAATEYGRPVVNGTTDARSTV